ncbi:MAG: putative Surface antigen, partial [Deltaproteobacteria bacterium]|nr:putative Surface antigen [Deltaproteobacteria bacterium]
HLCSPVAAQQVLHLDPSGRSGDERPDLLKEKLPSPPPTLVLPPPPPEKKGDELALGRVFVRQIIITGSTVFSEEELTKISVPYTNRTLASPDLETLRRELTITYIEKGYINSGALIPDQVVADGVLRIHVNEGRLDDVEVEGEKWFQESFIRDRLLIGSDQPLNIFSLQARLQLLQEDHRIERINAELKPGVRLGESLLKVRITETNPLGAWFALNNYQSPTVGAERGLVTVAHENLTGRGDIFRFTYGRSDGLDPEIDTYYSLPLNPRDTTIALAYRKNDYTVVEEPFEPLDIVSKTDIYGISLRHPVYRTWNQELALTLMGEYIENRTLLLGEPFSFSPGAELGKYHVTAFRFSQEWMNRSQTRVLAARSRFSLGLDALGATIRKAGIPDGQYLAWLGQLQWAEILNPSSIQIIARMDVQLATDSLLPVEQMAVGGRYTVRGYRENQLVRDQAVLASLESRIPLVKSFSLADYLDIAPFVDYGRAWNKDLPTPPTQSISSIGLGLRWGVTLVRSPVRVQSQFEIYWGYPLRDVDHPENNLQDDGIHLQFLLRIF